MTGSLLPTCPIFMIFFIPITADLEMKTGEPRLMMHWAGGQRARIVCPLKLKAPMTVNFKGRTYVFEPRDQSLDTEQIYALVVDARAKNELQEPINALHTAIRIPAPAA